MKLPKNKEQDKLDDMWQGGFCLATVNYCATTFDDPDNGTQRRVVWIQRHIHECRDCALALQAKNVEGDVAEKLGPEAFKLFSMGCNIFEFYGDRARQELDKLLRETNPELRAFIFRMKQRAGKPYPGKLDMKKGTWKR
jgi:hypothetical protein